MGPWSPPAHSAVKPISEYLKKQEIKTLVPLGYAPPGVGQRRRTQEASQTVLDISAN